MLFSRFYSDGESQRRIVQRLQQQRTDCGAADGETCGETFASDHPIIGAFIRAEFEEQAAGSGEAR